MRAATEWHTKTGDRIELIAMQDDPDPIEPGTCGTVTRVVQFTNKPGECVQIGVRWDDGRSLSLCEIDVWRVLS